MKFTLSIFFLFTSLIFTAQERVIDSLKRISFSLPADTNHVNTLNQLTDKIWQTGNYDSAIIYARKSIDLAQQLNFKRGLATAYVNTSLIFWKQGDYPKALEQDFKALKINEEINYKKGIAHFE